MWQVERSDPIAMLSGVKRSRDICFLCTDVSVALYMTLLAESGTVRYHYGRYKRARAEKTIAKAMAEVGKMGKMTLLLFFNAIQLILSPYPPLKIH